MRTTGRPGYPAASDWAVFSTQTCRGAPTQYLDATEPYDEIRVLLVNHGTESIGIAGAEGGERTAATRALKIAVLTAVDAAANPQSFATGSARAGRCHSHWMSRGRRATAEQRPRRRKGDEP